MEVYTCDSVSYVICRNLAFLMLDLETFLLHKFTFFCVTSFYAFVLICPHKRFIHSRFKNISAFLFLFSTDF